MIRALFLPWQRLAVPLAAALLAISGPSGAGPAQADAPAQAQVHLLAISICPPYRTDIPAEVCNKGAHEISDNLSDALGIPDSNVATLTDGQASARNFLATLGDLAGKLTWQDRLIIYLNGHGDAFSQWASYYDRDQSIARISERYDDPDEYVLVFWTREEPAVPTLALAEKEWLTVDDVVDAIAAIPAKVGIIIDSCSSNRAFQGFHRHGRAASNVDFILTSSGPEQVSNLNSALTMPLFTEQLVAALDLPDVKNLGQAVSHARMTTVLKATATCASLVVPESAFSMVFPGMAPPSNRTSDDKVAVPLWFCAQVPSVVDFSGEMTRLPVHRTKE